MVAKPLVTPTDFEGHPFQNQIETAIKWNVSSLAATYDASTGVWLFRPNDVVSRKQLAKVFEQLLIELLGKESLATSLIGSNESPYLDVPIQSA